MVNELNLESFMVNGPRRNVLISGDLFTATLFNNHRDEL